VAKMSLKVSDIFSQKLSEIQSRLPVRMKVPQKELSFQETLDKTMGSIYDASDSYDVVSAYNNLNIQNDAASRTSSSAFISHDRAKLMSKINSSIYAASEKYGVDANLIKAVIKQESAYNPYALSHAGAQGLMQLMPETAHSLGVEDPWDIEQNIDGGTKYLKEQLDYFGGNLQLSLAAYNAGPNNVIKYNGIPPFSETQDYVKKVMQYYYQYSRL